MSSESGKAERYKRLRLWRWVGALVSVVGVALLGLIVTTLSTPCEFDDGSTNVACYWDADRQGSGGGHDFVSFGYGRLVVPLG